MTAHITKAISKVTFWNIKGAFPSLVTVSKSKHDIFLLAKAQNRY